MLLKQSPRLIAGTLKPSAGQPAGRARSRMEPLRVNLDAKALSNEVDAKTLNLSKFSDPFGIQERTIDVVVDRMLKELSW